MVFNLWLMVSFMGVYYSIYVVLNRRVEPEDCSVKYLRHLIKNAPQLRNSGFLEGPLIWRIYWRQQACHTRQRVLPSYDSAQTRGANGEKPG